MLYINETNRFANQFITENPQKADDSYVGTWEDANVLEMKKFLGLLILMEIVHKPSISMFWSIYSLYHTPIFISNGSYAFQFIIIEISTFQ